MVKDRSKECQDCERLRQRIAELNSELLILKIAAFEATHAAGTRKHPSPIAADKARASSERKRGAPQISPGSS
jgi:hypothetical protein